jgi:nucleotide-binding universal stress UspA family protein
MNLKDVIVIFTDAHNPTARLNVAVELARRHGAHLVGLYLRQEISVFEGGMPYSGSRSEIEALMQVETQARARAAAEVSEVEAAFNGAADRAGLSREWRIAEGDVVHKAVVHARHSDLIVLGQGEPERHDIIASHVIEAVMLGAGRPVLAVPYVGTFTDVGRNVLVAWNASREATRAVNDAMPILAAADNVTVFSVNPPDAASGGPGWPGADISLHLARHGVKAEASSTVSTEVDTGNILLSRAADFGSDLIVMGGYGHSRQREFVLGGVTRTLLQHMTVPVLFSH